MIDIRDAIDPATIDWEQPQELTAKFAPEAYPVDVLPLEIRLAVEEVQRFVQAPFPLVAGCALSALSVAIQALVDIERASRLKGAVGLFQLSIAESGERKTTCDGFFTEEIRRYDREQAELAKPLLKDYASELSVWEATRSGILSAIKLNTSKAKSNPQLGSQLRDELINLERNTPEPPKVPRLMLGDETPESLVWRLAKEWPSAGIVSSEAGSILGAHGMGKESLMRNLATLNTLWDGGSLSVGRKTTESFVVEGARLTVGLQIQESTLKAFFDKSGGLARGTGFLARFLIAWPESTQGYRPFVEAPDTWPRLAAFNSRVSAILNKAAPINEGGILEPALLKFTTDAKTAWIAFHDSVEVELISGGELYDVRDVAAKTADNASRLAALFHVFEYGVNGAVGIESFTSASVIALWHLSESKRFFGALALPEELVNAARLDDWLIKHCSSNRVQFVPRRYIQQHSPIRSKDALNAALSELIELDRVRVVEVARRKDVYINPALFGGA